MFEMDYKEFITQAADKTVAFNPHENRTANGKVIVEGMKVRTNEWQEMCVVADATGVCCSMVTEAHVSNQMIRDGVWYSDHATDPTSAGCTLFYACRHDHWFTVAEPGQPGSKTFNGERLWAL